MKGMEIMKTYEAPSVDTVVLADSQIGGTMGTTSNPF